MRPLRPALIAALLAATAAPSLAQPPVGFEDAAVHAIQFVDASEGWAVGDEGVVWHSIDGGATWERQKTGTRASLRGVHFQTPYTGWAVGRIESPNGGPSIGVMLRTSDGGLKWEEVGVNALPGLNGIRFFDENNGVVYGDGSNAFPSGMFTTTNAGQTWRSVPGPRLPSCRSADFDSAKVGIAGGSWSKLGTVRDGQYAEAELDPLGGRAVHGVAMTRPLNRKGYPTSYAVADGGVVLVSDDGGMKWGHVNLGLSSAALACCDFHAVAAVGTHAWVSGRPGTVILHTSDSGATWEVQKTNLACAIHGLHFLSETVGWAVGEFGAIIGTTDGGKTWKTQRAGGQRAAALFLHARGRSVPLELVSLLGQGDGYCCAAVNLMAADPATADPSRAGDPDRLQYAIRQAGGVSGETLWSFPLFAHADGLAPRDLMASWDRAHAGKASEQLLRQAVLAIRIWRPEILVTDVAATDAHPADVLVLHAAKEAFKQAADPNAFPEQITALGLKPWAAKKLYALSPADPTAPIKLDLTEFHSVIANSPREAAETAVRIVADDAAPTDQRFLKLVAHRLEGAETHTALMDGILLSHGGEARRPKPTTSSIVPAELELTRKAIQTRRHLDGLTRLTDKELGGPDKVIAALGEAIKGMPDDIAARTVYGVGMQMARIGKWAEAREVLGVLTEKYPGHPVAVEGYRWLLRYHASSEARRRVEIQQKLVFGQLTFDPNPGAAKEVVPVGGSRRPAQIATSSEDEYRLYDQGMIMKWHQGCLDFEPRLAAFGPVYARDPAAWLCFLAARRQVGRHGDAEQFIRDYFKHSPGAATMTPGIDPWRDCLAAELWMVDRGAIPIPPKPLGYSWHTETRPFLDGKLDEPCWKDHNPLTLKVVSAGGQPTEEDRAFAEAYKTEARFAYDDRFLYVAVSCTHPAGQSVPPTLKRGRDADLKGHDRVDILIDLDRDYQTYYRFQVDHRGCLAEDCWGDRTWDPKYFVAFHPTDTGWTAEYAIPLTELSGERPSTGKTWAVNVSRVVPGKGLQAWSGPAENEPRPEGMGLLQFRLEK